jgi:hypothetical protein
MDAAVAIIPRCSEKMAFNAIGLRRFLRIRQITPLPNKK